MANITENTQYGTQGSTPSISNLSTIMKNLNISTPQSSANTVNQAIVNHYNPTAAASMFSAPAPYTPPATDTSTFPVNTPFQTPDAGVTTEPIPSYENFIAPDKNGNWVAPSSSAVLRNWPASLGGGQYVTDPTQPGKMIKSSRTLWDANLNPGGSKAALNGLSSKAYQIDHIVPLWIGGADTVENSELLDIPTHTLKTNIQAVPLTLLANGKITLDQAKSMALTWQTKDGSGLPDANNSGYVPLDVAEKYQQKWQNDQDNPSMWKYFGESFKENMQNFGQGWLPTPLREFAKGLVGGGTAGIVPGTEASPDSGVLGTVGNVAGNIVGTITGLGLLTKGLSATLGGAKAAIGIKNAVAITEDATKTAGLVTDIGDVASATGKTRMETLAKMAKSAGLLSLWGQIGVTGKEVTGQDTASFKNHVGQFMTDVAYGSLLGAAGQTMKGYATVALGTTAVSLMGGQEIVPALQNGALMTALHGLGYQKGMIDPKIQTGHEEAFKMASTTLNQYTDFPTVAKGDTVPTVLTFDTPTIEKLKTDYKTAHPNDTRFDNVNDSTGAAQIIGRNAKSSFLDVFKKSNGAISQDQFTKEMTRITTAQNAISNQTLDPVARQDKEWADLLSMGEALRPQTKSSQLASTFKNSNDILKTIPELSSEPTTNTTDTTSLPMGKGGITGYGGTLDSEAKANVDDFAKNPSNYDGKIYILKSDQATTSFMKLLQQEKISGGETIGDPSKTLRSYVRTTDGQFKPIGYVPQEESFDTKKDNLNKTYQLITKRLQEIRKSAKTPESMMNMYNADKAGISMDLKTAQDLFARKTEAISDEELYNILKPVNAYEKLDSNLNNSNIADNMNKLGLNFLAVDPFKAWEANGSRPRWNPENPYASIEVTDQNWKQSIDMNKKSTLSPMENAIKTVVEQQQAKTVAKQSGVMVKKNTEIENAPKNLESVAKKVESFTVNNIQKLESTGETLEKGDIITDKKGSQMQVVNAKDTVVGQKEISLKKVGGDGTVQNITIKVPEVIPIPPTEAYKNVSQASTSLVEPTLAPETSTTLETSKTPEKTTTLSKYKTIQSVASKDPVYTATSEFFNDMVARIDNVKLKAYVSPEDFKTNMENIIDSFKRKNPGLSDKDFKNAMSDAKGRAQAYVQDQIENTYNGTKYFGSDETYKTKMAGPEKNILERRLNEITRKENGRGTEEDPGLVLSSSEKAEKADLKKKIPQYSDLQSQTDAIESKSSQEKRSLTDDEKKTLRGLEQKRFDLSENYQKDPNLVMANKYGLKLTEPNDAGFQYLVADKKGNPVFSDEYLKLHDVKGETPLEHWGSFLKGDWEASRGMLTKNVQDWGKSIESMKIAKKPYAKAWAQTLDTIFTEKFGDRWQTSWKLNSALKDMKEMFSTKNPEGHGISETNRGIAARTLGNTPAEIKERVGKANAITKAISAQAEAARIKDFGASSKSPLFQGDTQVYDRIKDSNQTNNVIEDLTPFEIMMNGLITNPEARTKLISDYNSLRREMGSGNAKPTVTDVKGKTTLGTADEMKKTFEQIKALSVNIPEEVKTWKLGQKIDIKNNEPTVQQGIKDAYNVAMSILSKKKTPGYVKFENIKNMVLDKMSKIDGKGGPYDGQGGPIKKDSGKFIVVRHGATANNEQGLNRGMININLSKLGVKQVSGAAEKLKDKGATGIIASPLKRTKDTAQIISMKTGLPIIETDKALLPWNIGEFQGKSIEDTLPALHHLMENPDQKPPGKGESFNNFKERSIEGLHKLHEKHPDEKLVLVTHHRVERLIEAHTNKVGGHGNFDINAQKQKGIEPGDIKEHEWKNLFPKKHDGKGGIFGDLWEGVKNLLSSTTTYTAPKTTVPAMDTEKLLKAIASNETSAVKGNKYKSSEFSGIKNLGNAMGKYRVTKGELQSYGTKYLGKTVTPEEFQSSPELQDSYMRNKAIALNKQGYTPQQIADIHNKGMTHSSPPGSATYQNPDYVRDFNRIYNKVQQSSLMANAIGSQ